MDSFRSWAKQFQEVWADWGLSLQQSASTRSLRRVTVLRKRLSPRKGAPEVVVIGLATIALTSTIGQRFYNQPRLSNNTIAPDTITAPANAQVEDKATTDRKRMEARTIAVPMLMIDPDATEQSHQALQDLLAQGTSFRQQAGSFPFIEVAVLSEPSQRYLQQADDWQWQEVVKAVQDNPATARPADRGMLNQLADPPQRKAAEELQRFKTRNTAAGLSGLIDRITAARQKYAATVGILQSNEVYNSTLLQLSDAVWQKMQQEVKQTSDRILAQGISPGFSDEHLETVVNVQLSPMPPEARTIASRMLLTALQPNLIRDEIQTRLRAEKAAQMVEPEMVSIRQGEVIVQAGQVITPRQFILLDHFKLSRRETNWFGLIGLVGLVSGSIVVFWQIEQRLHAKGLRNRDYWLVWMMALSTPLLILLKAPSTNLPAIGFLMGTFYGSVLAVTSVGLLTVLLPIGMGIGATQWIPSAAAGLVVALMAARVRSREELALLGLGAGLTQGALYLVIGGFAGVALYGLLSRAVLEALIGLAWSVVAIGISPYIEHLFDVVTTLRLVELANPNRPLLKRLSTETPGTFQHTLFVANLAEAAARALGCNVELVRTGTLYHDIGKMHDPLGFIENQMGGVNKHDVINDPWTSAKIIKKHVSEGLVMAGKARLPKAVQAFIPEHQGTMTIAYFYHQAKQLAQADPSIVIDESDFRYDGPAPQSRETGIVMLADSCEAALRSLKDATPEEALNMINKILAARWKDGQLDESGLTREEMGQIAEVFVQVWQQSNHQRIAYPKVGSK